MTDSIFHTLAYPCGQIREFVYDYLEGGLPGIVRLRFRVHLMGCKDCRGFVRLYRMAANPAAFREETPPPAEMLDRTLRFLEREGVLPKDSGDSGKGKREGPDLP
jgi:predicted anti-sigma-YlaC factor YlaD